MTFDIGILSQSFKSAIDWMLSGQHGGKIINNLAEYQHLKQQLPAASYPERVLKLLVETKVTHSYYRKLSTPENFEGDFSNFYLTHKQNFMTPQAANDLVRLVNTYKVFPEDKKKVESWVRILLDYPTLKSFSDELYNLRLKGQNGLLREKGADHYLRGVGYWDIVPIDLHEKRFLVRTGIFHALSVKKRQDPLDIRSLQYVLSTFCSLYLKGKRVQGIDIGSAPGIADLFVWSFCADDRYQLCGSIPRCEQCPLEDACLFRITNNNMPLAKGGLVSDSTDGNVGHQNPPSIMHDQALGSRDLQIPTASGSGYAGSNPDQNAGISPLGQPGQLHTSVNTLGQGAATCIVVAKVGLPQPGQSWEIGGMTKGKTNGIFGKGGPLDLSIVEKKFGAVWHVGRTGNKTLWIPIKLQIGSDSEIFDAFWHYKGRNGGSWIGSELNAGKAKLTDPLKKNGFNPKANITLTVGGNMVRAT